MPYMLDKWQWISGINMKVLPADYAICYTRLDPPYAVLVGYAGVSEPNLRLIEGNVEKNSVGNWPFAIIPYGSGNRSFPMLDNGSVGVEVAAPTLLPTMEQFKEVYTWHVGRSHAWGISDQILVNLKKLKEDYPDNSNFQIGMASHSWHPSEDGNGDPLPKPVGWETGKDLRMTVGIRTYVGDGGSFQFAETDAIDPFGNLIKDADIAHYLGGESELSAEFESFAAVAPITIYGNTNAVQLRGANWNIDWKRPKKSLLTGGTIQTQPA